MNKFKMLLNFSIEKRIKNRTFIVINALLCFFVIAVMFLDIIISKVSPESLNKQVVYVKENEICEYLKSIDTGFEYQCTEEVDDAVVLKEGGWIVDLDENYHFSSNTKIPEMSFLYIKNLLISYEQVVRINSLPTNYQQMLEIPEFYSHTLEVESNSGQSSWGFIVITTMYFFALSFASVVANEVVYEKSTRMMELILTSVDAKVHMFSKLFSGWILLIIQIGLMLSYLIAGFIIRYLFDGGGGIISLLKDYGLIQNDTLLDFNEIIKFIFANKTTLVYLGIAIYFMMIGILIIQAVLVILSSFVSNIEESGNIQSPFYLMFMGIYYLTLFMNTPMQMNNGWGKIFSYVPILSMLFMPCRMFYYQVKLDEIFISALISLITFGFIIVVGSKIYKLGVLDYSNQSLLKKVRKNYERI